MNDHLSDNLLATSESAEPGPSRPVVLLLLGGWGVAPAVEANFIRSSKIDNWLNLIKEYPVALLKTSGKNLNVRYATLGAGREISDENESVAQTLTKVLAHAGKRQLKIFETERFAALTHFYNGGATVKDIGEEWVAVSSENRAKTLKLSLALKRAVKEIIKALANPVPYDLIVATIPTVDLAASSGDLDGVKKAVAELDKNLKIIVNEVLDKKSVLLISSAAGNAEKMILPGTDSVDSGLTENPVPLVVVGEEFAGQTIGLADPLNNDLSLLEPAGTLADVAPTILSIMNLPQPPEMSGQSLFAKK